MGDETQILLKMYEEQWKQARHIEGQRATITNIVLIISSAILGFIADNGLSKDTLPITILLIILGFYGAISSEKLYERFQFCVNRATVFRDQIDKLHPKIQLQQLNENFEETHKNKYSGLSKVRLHYLWLFLHVAVLVGGLALSIIIFYK